MRPCFIANSKLKGASPPLLPAPGAVEERGHGPGPSLSVAWITGSLLKITE